MKSLLKDHLVWQKVRVLAKVVNDLILAYGVRLAVTLTPGRRSFTVHRLTVLNNSVIDDAGRTRHDDR